MRNSTIIHNLTNPSSTSSIF